MEVGIYTEQPIINVGQTIEEWFGPVDEISKNICTIFSYLFLFTTCICLLCVLFKRK